MLRDGRSDLYSISHPTFFPDIHTCITTEKKKELVFTEELTASTHTYTWHRQVDFEIVGTEESDRDEERTALRRRTFVLPFLTGLAWILEDPLHFKSLVLG